MAARDKRQAERAARAAGDDASKASTRKSEVPLGTGQVENVRLKADRKRQFGAGSPSGAARAERQREEDIAARERAALPAVRRSLRLSGLSDNLN